MDNVQQLLQQFDSLKTKRQNINSVWQDIADYFLPNSDSVTTSRSPGENRTKTKVFDTTAGQAASFLTSELYTGLTNPSLKWFGIGIDNLEQTINMSDQEQLMVDQGLEFARDILLNLFNSAESTFTSNHQQFLASLTSYGTACLMVEDSLDKGVKFSHIPIREVFISEDKFGVIDTVYRLFKMSNRQLLQSFQSVFDDADVLRMTKEPEEMVEIIHCVKPKNISDSSKKGMFTSTHVLVEKKKLLKEGFYYENPYLVCRFDRVMESVYGVSPAWQCLPSVRLINKMFETLLKAGQLLAQPPLLVADDGVMMPLNAVPNGIIMGGLSHDYSPKVAPLNVGGQPAFGLELLKHISKSIRDTFFVDQLVFRDTGTMTATEVIQRQQEALKLLAPYISRLQSEYLSPLINKTLAIYARSGKLGNLPMLLKGANLKIAYSGNLVMLQKLSEIQKFQSFIQNVAPMAQLSPSSLDYINFDKVVQQMADDLGIWKRVQRGSDEVDKMRQQKQEAAALQNQLNIGQQLADINSKVTK